MRGEVCLMNFLESNEKYFLRRDFRQRLADLIITIVDNLRALRCCAHCPTRTTSGS